MKTVKTVCGIVLCCALCCILAGGGVYYARRGTALRQKPIRESAVYRLSAFTEMQQRDTFVLCACRGLSATYPENTLPAIRAAGEAGFTHVLLDTAVTRDQVPVLLADDTVERMTAGRGLVRAMTFDALRQLPIDNGAGLDRQEQTLYVPSLTQALETCAQYGMTPLLTVRTLRGASSLSAALERYGGNFLLVSAQKEVLQMFRAKGCACIYRTDALDEADVAYARRTGCGLMADAAQSTPQTLRTAQQTTQLWVENADTRTVMRHAAQNGVTRFVTRCILPMAKQDKK